MLRSLALAVLLLGLALGFPYPSLSAEVHEPHGHHDHSEGDAERHLVLFVTSGLSGHYANGEATIAGLVATLRHEVEAARGAGHDVAVIDAGRTLVPYAESRADEGVTMAMVLRGLGCDAFVPAPMDLTLRLRHVAGVARALKGCPTVRAFESESEGDDDLVPSARIDLGDESGSGKTYEGRPLSLEIHSVFDPVFFGDLEALGVTAERFDLESLGSRLSTDSLQIVVTHSRGFGNTLVDRDLTWKALRGSFGFDLVIDPDLGHDLELERRLRETHADDDETPEDTRRGHQHGSVFLVGRALDTATPWTYARIDMPLRWDAVEEGGAGHWRPVDVEMEVRTPDPDIVPDPTLDASLVAAFQGFRDVWDLDLPDGAPEDREALITFAMDALRERTKAEIAVVNRGVLRPVAEQYWTPPLTRETVLRLLTLDQQMAIGRLTGNQLKSLWTESARRRRPDGNLKASALHFRGLTRDEDADGKVTFRVNGRALRDDDPYLVVTNTFLTSGGDNYKIFEDMETTRLELDETPLEARHDVVLPRLQNPTEPLYDPAARPLWRLGIDKLAFDFTSISVDADDAYSEVSDSRASASDASQATLDLTLFADQDWPVARWENRLSVRYGIVETDAIEELADDLRLEIAGVFHRGPWKHAEPYLAYLFDSEVRRNLADDGSRLPRQHEQSLALGLSWTAERWPRIRLGVMARHQDDAERADRFGMTAETWYRYPGGDRWPGFSFDALSERVEDEDAVVWRVDLDFRLVFDLPGGLKLTPGYEIYVYDDSRLDGSATYQSLTLGVRWDWLRKIQR